MPASGARADTRQSLVSTVVACTFACIGLSVLDPLRVVSDLGHDPLRSVGLLIPPVSLWLACRQWTWRDWQDGGSWWGLGLVACAFVLSILRMQMTHARLMYGEVMLPITLVPLGVLLCLYCSGAVLLFGGGTAWSKARFPLLLLLLVNPVPQAFQNLVDLPLQSIAAEVTRNFAHALKVPVDGDALTMMFSPQLGIFIAPGCDGMRGATTLGLLALVSGHLCRLPWQRWLVFVICSVLLAYLLNLMRLCGVIVYYWLVLHFPQLRADGATVDYFIGGTLFFLAAVFLVRVPRLGLKP